MKKCADIGKIPYSMGIDTWAVDFVLLDDQGQRIGDAVAYRDARTDGMDKQVYEIISKMICMKLRVFKSRSLIRSSANGA